MKIEATIIASRATAPPSAILFLLTSIQASRPTIPPDCVVSVTIKARNLPARGQKGKTEIGPCVFTQGSSPLCGLGVLSVMQEGFLTQRTPSPQRQGRKRTGGNGKS